MDPSAHQTPTLQEIEKQVSQGQETGPKLLSQEEVKDKSIFVNLLAGLGISIVATAFVVVILIYPFSQKKAVVPKITTQTVELLSPNITLVTQYENPFDTSTQYENPFVASRNPFSQFTQ